MAKAKNTRTAATKQSTEPTTPAPAAPTTNPANDPTIVPPTTDKNVADPSVNDSDITKTTDDSVAPQAQGAAAQAPVNDDPTPADDAVEPTEVKESMKREELNTIAAQEGLASASKYKDKAAVVEAVERVRAGADAAEVDAELAPEVEDTGDRTQVEASAPFYDLQGKKYRKAGEKFSTSATRAGELRGLKLIK